MTLYRLPQQEQHHNNYNNNISNITDKIQGDRIILLQLNSGNFEITEDTCDEANAAYMFLTKTLGWKESLNEEDNATSDSDLHDVTMGWCKGLKLFGERGEEAVGD